MDGHTTTAGPGFTIGRLARAAGVNVETIRYYQRIGLVTEPPRPARGYRRYPSTTVDRIRFIKRAQELGFSLGEIRELLALDDAACQEARQIAERKLKTIQKRIRDLAAMENELHRLVDACRRDGDDGTGCAIIRTLAGPG
ncbi:MAG TPA: Hg(II)-responsive transcriptional regulator [Sedimenticola thiotaurini]|uniref:Mercuric resistance operon regulatory protein n=1 Tax=Sedimenticola thiotaurini TaxID=1543721 RepID=A0A831RPW1_9GAMM|nr:Hg(II)-responsive transcriptional regulator [Sedimenticola thiotaurini]